jgi:GTP-binding protein EngB required for normal cell division
MASTTLSFDQTQYKEKSRKLVTLVNQLRDAGAQASFTVPTLVVCGNYSAGKSSLLERLCAVKLPRAAGTCTKCPTEVRSRPVNSFLAGNSCSSC